MQSHWDEIYAARPAGEASWFEADPAVSMRLIADAIRTGARSVLDVGAGASVLVERLLELDLERIGVLDISEVGLEIARHRLGDRADEVEWIVADVTAATDVGRFDVWHDRATFHFLTEPVDRAGYVRLAARTVRPGGSVIIATFAPDGPERCSGLSVSRYDADRLASLCGPAFELVGSEPHVHTTPGGVKQRFVYTTLRRAAKGAKTGTGHAAS